MSLVGLDTENWWSTSYLEGTTPAPDVPEVGNKGEDDVSLDFHATNITAPKLGDGGIWNKNNWTAETPEMESFGVDRHFGISEIYPFGGGFVDDAEPSLTTSEFASVGYAEAPHSSSEEPLNAFSHLQNPNFWEVDDNLQVQSHPSHADSDLTELLIDLAK